MRKEYNPSDLFFDAATNPDEGFVAVFLIDKETESDDCLGDHNVSGLPDYLYNQMENEWAPDLNPEKTVEEVTADMIDAGFEHKKMITWF